MKIRRMLLSIGPLSFLKMLSTDTEVVIEKEEMDMDNPSLTEVEIKL